MWEQYSRVVRKNWSFEGQRDRNYELPVYCVGMEEKIFAICFASSGIYFFWETGV